MEALVSLEGRASIEEENLDGRPSIEKQGDNWRGVADGIQEDIVSIHGAIETFTRDLYGSFCDAPPAKVFQASEFPSVSNLSTSASSCTLPGNAVTSPGMAQAWLDHSFDAMDANGDGVVDRQEFAAALSSPSQPPVSSPHSSPMSPHASRSPGQPAPSSPAQIPAVLLAAEQRRAYVQAKSTQRVKMAADMLRAAKSPVSSSAKENQAASSSIPQAASREQDESDGDIFKLF